MCALNAAHENLKALNVESALGHGPIFMLCTHFHDLLMINHCSAEKIDFITISFKPLSSPWRKPVPRSSALETSGGVLMWPAPDPSYPINTFAASSSQLPGSPAGRRGQLKPSAGHGGCDGLAQQPLSSSILPLLATNIENLEKSVRRRAHRARSILAVALGLWASCTFRDLQS